VAIFFEELGGVAARAVVDPIAGISVAAIAAAALAGVVVIVPAATAAGLTIVDQRFVLCSQLKPRRLRHQGPETSCNTPTAERPERIARAPRFGQRLHLQNAAKTVGAGRLSKRHARGLEQLCVLEIVAPALQTK